MKDHAELPRLREAIARCLNAADVWSGTVYRMTSTRYANRDDLLTGAGSKKAGGRWNPPKHFRAIYSSLDLPTALAEFLEHYRYFKLIPAKGLPQVTVAMELKLRRCLDLTDGAIRHRLGVSLERLRAEDWRKQNRRGRQALTQALGLAVWEHKLEALRVPSAAPKDGVNLVVFPANLQPPQSWIRAMKAGELPDLR